MGTPHINAEMGDIAETVLLPGDPLRAQWIAETFLQDVKQYNNVRGMMGFTGTYKGKRVSVQGTGMGVPSLGIYVNELIRFFGVKKVIRVGSAGSYQADVKVRDLVIAMSSATTTPFSSHMPPAPGIYTPTADPYLFMQAVKNAEALGMKPKLGSVLTSDAFYDDYDENDADLGKKTLKKWEKWSKMGILAVEMESHGLYSIGSAFRDQGVQALSLLTISDSLVTGEATTAEERQTTFKEMIELALSLA